MKKQLFYTFLFLAFIQQAVAQGDYTPLSKGVMFKIAAHGNGQKVKLNDVVSFQVMQKTDKDSTLFSSYTLGHPIQIQVVPSRNIGDLMDVFPLLSVKDSAIVRVPTDSIFKDHEDQRPPFFAKGSYLIMVVKVEKTQSLDEAIAERNAAMEKLKTDETALAQQYITDHKMVLNTTASGLKYAITVPSASLRKARSGDTVVVNYIGRTLDGHVFDTNIEAAAKAFGLPQGHPYEPLVFPLGQQKVIQGWDEGLALLNEGAKGVLFIPSGLGYGPQGSGDAIKPYSTLLFDVELVKVLPLKIKAAKPGVKAPAKTAAKSGVATKKPAATTVKKPAAAPVKKKA